MPPMSEAGVKSECADADMLDMIDEQELFSAAFPATSVPSLLAPKSEVMFGMCLRGRVCLG